MVCHNDGNPLNNNISNLRADTAAGNSADMLIHGTRIRGEMHPSAKLSALQVQEIRSAYVPHSRHLGAKALSKKYGVSHLTIGRILRGERWGWM